MGQREQEGKYREQLKYLENLKHYTRPWTWSHSTVDYSSTNLEALIDEFGLIFVGFLPEQSRRDDLESLGYVLMYFLRGRWDTIL